MEEVDDSEFAQASVPLENPNPPEKRVESRSSSSSSSEYEKEPPESYPAIPEIQEKPSGYPYLIEHIDKDSDSSESNEEEKAMDQPLHRKQTIQERLTILRHFGIEIEVTNPQVISTTFRKHVLYTVTGTDSIGGFQVQRRYKEFLALRKLVIIEWPGCCILQLPPKQAMGNLQPEFIENRRKLLEYYLKSISKYSYILSSEEFQLFLRGPANFHRTEIANRSANYMQIAEKYSKIFEEYLNFTSTPETEKEIRELTNFYNSGKLILDRLDMICLENQATFKHIDQSTVKILETIKDLSGFYGESTIEVEQRVDIEDPYTELINWSRNILLEVKGVTECINRRADMEKYRRTLLNKVEDEKKTIIKKQQGKKSFMQYLTKKSNEFYISRCENNIKSLEENIQSIEKIISITAAMILKKEVSDFKARMESTLKTVVDISIELNEKEIQKLVVQFEQLGGKF